MKAHVALLLLALTLVHESRAQVPASLIGSIAWEAIKLYRDTPENVVVSTQGTGVTREQAVERALVSASGEALGALIVSEQQTNGERMVRDEIVQQIKGVVNRYEVQNCTDEAGHYICRVRAEVGTKTMANELISRGAKAVEVDVDGNSMYAQQVSVRNSVVAGRKLVFSVVERLQQTGIDITVTAIQNTPTAENSSLLQIIYKVTLNGIYMKSLADTLAQVSKNMRGKLSGSLTAFSLLSESIGWFGNGYSQFTDVELINGVITRLKAQQRISIGLVFKGQGDLVLGRACDTYTTKMFGNKDPVNHQYQTPTYSINGRQEDERIAVTVIPENILYNLTSIATEVGCKEKTTIPSKGFSTTALANTLSSGRAVLHSR